VARTVIVLRGGEVSENCGRPGQRPACRARQPGLRDGDRDRHAAELQQPEGHACQQQFEPSTKEHAWSLRSGSRIIRRSGDLWTTLSGRCSLWKRSGAPSTRVAYTSRSRSAVRSDFACRLSGSADRAAQAVPTSEHSGGGSVPRRHQAAPKGSVPSNRTPASVCAGKEGHRPWLSSPPASSWRAASTSGTRPGGGTRR
jgi:hypothetical protein